MRAESHATVLEMIRSKRCATCLKQKTKFEVILSRWGNTFYSFELKAVG